MTMWNAMHEQSGWHRTFGIGVSLTLAMVLSACGGSEDTTNAGATETPRATPAQISQTSAADYDSNTSGLITGATLKNWIDDWESNRPSGIRGNLVILQTSPGEAGYEFIKPNGTDVFTYEATEWVETRSNGVIETRSMVPSGRSMDTFLAKYDIDPENDLIVCAQGTAGAGQSMRAGRCWYMFRYWGTPQEHVAVLNGGNQWNGENTALAATDFSTTGSTPPGTGTASVKDLEEINFALQATLEDMMDVVPSQDTNLLSDGVLIWDARGTNQYSAGEDDGTGTPVANYMDTFQNGGAAQGHPNGTLNLDFSNLVVPTEGWRFKSKAEIQSYLDGNVDADGNGFVNATYQGVGAGRAYQDGDTIYTYCETTYRAMITGFASAAILGLPTRFYDGAMVEWHSMSNIVDSNGDYILPWDSPWRTDKASWSMFSPADLAANVEPRSIINAYASSANAIINEDLAYKGITVDDGSGGSGDSGGSSGSSGGGAELPANACG